MKHLDIPVGISDFAEIRRNGFYYIDKSGLIDDLLKTTSTKVTLITRPRRFGKTLGMSMLEYFFDVRKDSKELFAGLELMKNQEICQQWMNQYPTIFVSFRQVDGLNFDGAFGMMTVVLADLFNKHLYLQESPKATEFQKAAFAHIASGNASVKEAKSSLGLLTDMMRDYYGKKVILLIDEYDVPLDKAFQHGYYDEMVSLIRGMLGSVLKTNDSLQMGVLTGCLRITKESIFTGLNNFKVYSVAESAFDEYFGFTDQEVGDMLREYGLEDDSQTVKEWYDGYLFGNIEIYNPWSTLMYVKNKIQDQSFKPISFWANTSGNDLVVNYIQNGSDELHEEFEQLIQGKSLTKYIKPELTYREMDNINNIYSFLLLTGYLKIKEDLGENKYKLIIPNKEVYEIYKQTFMSYFEDYTFVRKEDLYQSLVKGDVDQANEILGDILSRSISYFDNEESFYHGFLLGLFSGKKIKSNREAMHGRFDLCILPKQIFQTALILECKHSKSVKDLIKDASEGAQQIIDHKYEEEIINDGYLHVKGYGIAFYKKYCYIVKVQA